MDALDTGAVVQGRYEIVGPFVEGRFSTLYHALDRHDGTAYVIRSLHDDPYLDENTRRDARRQILREGRVLARLKHRNLPRVLHVLEEGERLHLLLEDFQGRTLARYLDEVEGFLSEPHLFRVLIQFLSVLEYLHGRTPPIIHRDLRPESVVVTPHGMLKLAEFGLARLPDPDSGKTLFRAVGSPIYASPEQLGMGRSAPAHDIHAVGAIMYFLATRREPPRSLDRLNGKASLEPIASLRPGGLPHLEPLICRMMAARRDERYPTAQEVKKALLEAFPADASRSGLLPGLVPSALALGRATMPDEAPAAASLPGDWESLLGLSWGGPPHEEKAEHATLVDMRDEALAQFPFVDLRTVLIDRETARRVLPESVARSISGVLTGRRSSREITVAVKDPTQVHIQDHISYATHGQYKVSLVRADPALIDLARQFVYDASMWSCSNTWSQWVETQRAQESGGESLSEAPAPEPPPPAIEPPVPPTAPASVAALEVPPAPATTRGVPPAPAPVREARIVPAVEPEYRILQHAVSMGASDVHLEVFETEGVLRYRIDGMLQGMDRLSPRASAAFVRAVKILAGLDPAIEGLPQGARFPLTADGREFQARLSLVPVPHGENVVLHLSPRRGFDRRLQSLGFSPHNLEVYQWLLTLPHGLIIVSGPRGSGRTTTLYATLLELHRPERKLLTVEDPIDCELPGIAQVQVGPASPQARRAAFNRALRESLNQDPDVLLVGCIRDQETAAICVEAALTGHLLLSALEATDALGGIARLRDFGTEPYLVASALTGGLAQRLVRRTCPDCRVEAAVGDGDRAFFEAAGISEVGAFLGTGCPACRQTGYRGQLAIHEVLEVTPGLREAIRGNAPIEELRRLALQQGFLPLPCDGMHRVVEGATTLDEVRRVVAGA